MTRSLAEHEGRGPRPDDRVPDNRTGVRIKLIVFAKLF